MSASAAILRASCLLLCLAPGSWQLSITELVVPKSVEAGGQAELQCRYGLSEGETEPGVFVKWWWIPPSATNLDTKQLYQRSGNRPPVSLHHNVEIKANDTDTIVLSDMKPSNSGRYECEVSIMDEVRKHDDLIVYTKGTGPHVNVTAVDDGPDEDDEADYLIECQAEDVAPMPDLVVTVNGEIINTTETIRSSDDGLYSIIGSATVSGQEVKGAEVRCELFYENTSITHPPFVDQLAILLASDMTTMGSITTEEPADDTEVDVTSDSLQNLRDYGSQLQCSWILLAAVLLATKMLAL